MTTESRRELGLRDIERCLQSAVPASIASCSADGIPNVTHISIVREVDANHVALSFQFFNKTRENVLANPRVQILVTDPLDGVFYRLDASYVRTETSGPLYDRMRSVLEVVAAEAQLAEVFRLRGADVYRVHAVEELAHDFDLAPPDAPPDRIAALESVSARLVECDDLESLLDATLAGLAEHFGHEHAMVLFADGDEKRLFTVASRGFAETGVGAEVAFGDGLVGKAASERKPVRVGHRRVVEEYAAAVRASTGEGSWLPEREIPLPGLADAQAELAVPLLARDRVLGVLVVQSAEPARFTLADELALTTLARHLAISFQMLGHGGSESPASRAYEPQKPNGVRARIKHFAADDSVFVDDEYLIKGLSGRILVRLLQTFERDGRVDFTNKELRLDDGLGLSGYRDNLEARLILLRRRLDERSSLVRLSPTGRGRFRLEVVRPFELVVGA